MWRKIFLLCLSVYSGPCLIAQDSAMNDHMFPAAAAARPFIDYDPRGFLVNGKRTFIVSAGIEYARVPRALWADRLLRLKRAGFNTVEIYTFWNFHEAQQGKFDFSGDHDLDYFLKLVRDMGMYCIARVGPYYCAEWDQGGYPLWLRFKPHLRVREPNDSFQKYVGLFFDHLLPIIRDNQIHHGGSVIMVQLENEHTEGWGTVMPNRYFTFLRDKALQSGIEVPYFFSGLHHDTDPAGDKANLDDPTRPNPWMSTEFWAVWFSQYGAAPGDGDKYERFTRKIISRGGNGYNYYMAHGGSNFGYTNNDEDAASYDYGSAIGQAGDLRPLYYRMKRCAYFATSFADVLENSRTLSVPAYHNDTSINETIRSGGGRSEIYFFDNHTDHAVSIQHTKPGTDSYLPNCTITIGPGEILPVLKNYFLTSHVYISWSSVRILGLQTQGNTKTLVCYGEPGTEASLFLTGTPFQIVKKGNGSLDPANPGAGVLAMRTTIVSGAFPDEYLFKSGGELIRILFVSTALADRTWFLESNGQKYVLCGPAYPAGFSAAGGRYQLQTEDPMQPDAAGTLSYPVRLYTATGGETLSPAINAVAKPADTLLTLSGWTRHSAAAPAAANYDDSGWPATDNPAQMGMDGNDEPEAWYRTSIEVAQTGTYKLECSGGDRASVFLDGKWIMTDSLYKGSFLLPVARGRHLLSLYTAHDGRDKLAGYIGPLDSVNAKGLTGEVWLKRDTAAAPTITDWRFVKAVTADDSGKPVPDAAAAWTPYKSGSDAFDHQSGYGWFETRIEKPAFPVSRLELLFKSVDEDATVFIGGKQLASHKGWNQPFRVPVAVGNDTKWPIVLDVFIENHSNEGGIDQPVVVNYFGRDDQSLKHWRMQGGTPMDGGIPQPLSAGDSSRAGGGPGYYFAHFNLPDTASGKVWRVTPTGLDHGYVWINGHNLGHYPEKIDAPGLYIPANWLKSGDNELKILDETGATPLGVNIKLEKPASRITKRYTASIAAKSVLNSGHAK